MSNQTNTSLQSGEVEELCAFFTSGPSLRVSKCFDELVIERVRERSGCSSILMKLLVCLRDHILEGSDVPIHEDLVIDAGPQQIRLIVFANRGHNWSVENKHVVGQRSNDWFIGAFEPFDQKYDSRSDTRKLAPVSLF